MNNAPEYLGYMLYEASQVRGPKTAPPPGYDDWVKAGRPRSRVKPPGVNPPVVPPVLPTTPTSRR